jgi:hypothetical protein
MEHFDYKEITSNCFKLAIKDLTEAMSLYEQEHYALSEKKIDDVIYRTSSALYFINRERD